MKYRGPDCYYIPRGKPPVELTGTDAETVDQWMEDVQQAMPEKCGSSTYLHWLRYFYSCVAQEPDEKAAYEEVRGHIREAFGLSRVPPRRPPPPPPKAKAKAPPPPPPPKAKAPPPPPSRPKPKAPPPPPPRR